MNLSPILGGVWDCFLNLKSALGKKCLLTYGDDNMSFLKSVLIKFCSGECQ